MIENTYRFGRLDKPKSLVILLHGLGSNGQDLISLAPYFAQKLPETAFISPDAPFACDMVPPGYPNSFQWFSLQDRDPDKILSGIKTAVPVLEAYITEQIAQYGVTADQCALVGFSQGTMMGLYAAPRYKQPLAGVLGYSGALFMGNESEIANKPPIHLIHGEADDVVPVEAFSEAKNTLTAHNFEFSGYTQSGLTHSIDEKGIESGSTFLSNVLS